MKNIFKRRTLLQRLSESRERSPLQPICKVHIASTGVFILQLRPPHVAPPWADKLLQAQHQRVMQALQVAPELVHHVLVVADASQPLSAANMCYLSQIDEFVSSYSMPLFKPREVKPLIQQWRQQQPQCSRCKITMQLHIRQRGEHAGRLYYSCGNFPDCRQLKAAN